MREYETLSANAAAIIEANQRKDIRIAAIAGLPLLAVGAAFVSLCFPGTHGHAPAPPRSRRPAPATVAHSAIPERLPALAHS